MKSERSHFHRVNYFFFLLPLPWQRKFRNIWSSTEEFLSRSIIFRGDTSTTQPQENSADSTKNQKTRIKGSYYWNVLLEKSWLIIWLNYSFPDSAKQLSVRASCYIPLLHTQICLPMPTYYIKKSSWQRENYFYFTTSGRIRGHRRFCNSLHPKNFHAF